MNEYRIDIKVRNNLLMTAIENAGYKNVAEFSRASGVSQNDIGKFLNLKKAPITQEGKLGTAAEKIADCLGLLPEDLWTQEQMQLALPTNRSHFSMSHKEMMLTLSRNTGELLEDADLNKHMENKDIERVVGELLDGLTPKESKVLRLRFGIGVSHEYTLEQIAESLDVTKNRIYQIEAKALRKLKHPSRKDAFKSIGNEIPEVNFGAIKKAYEKAKRKP